MPYFDHTDSNDTALLHSDVRTHSELENVSEQVEWEVIDHYREEWPELDQGDYTTYDPDVAIQTTVKLHGYADDPDNASANLKQALRRTIADVVSNVLRQYDNERGIQSHQLGNRSETYAGEIPTKDDWPDNWNHRLARYDNRDPVYGL